MKKFTLLTAVVLLVAMLFTACAEKPAENFDLAAAMENLKAKGLTVGNSYKTQEELAEGNDMLNLEIGAWGGDFTVELKKYESMIQDGDQMKNVKFYTFGTQAQAKGYAELYVSNRVSGNVFRVAYSGCTVIITNLPMVESEIKLEFK